MAKTRSHFSHFARNRGISNPRALLAFALCSVGALLAGLTFAEKPPGSVAHSIAYSPDHPSLGLEQTGLYRGMPVTYRIENGKAIFQGDIILEKVDRVAPIDLDSFGVAYSQYLWLKVGNQYQIPYVIGAGSGNLTNLNTAISQFNNTFSNIKLVARTAQTDYVNFYFDPNDNSGQCEANLGRVGGQQQVGGAGGSFTPCLASTIMHEMGHTLGLYHEHTRPDRNTYLSVNYNNVIKGSFFNFDQVYDNEQQATLFDFASLMEYPAFTFTRNGNPVIETIPAGIPLSNPNGFSAGDIDGIQRLYSQAPTAITVTSNPPGLQVIVDGVTVTTPHVYSWTINSTHTLAIPTGVQSLPGFIDNGPEPTTFYYTYGRWNDSTVASHSITVLPGNGAPTAPVTSPAVTTYSANFIQLVPYSATVFPSGTGTVVPSPAPQTYPGSGLVFYVARQLATLTATPNSGQNFYAFINAPYYLPGGTSANPKTFYVPDNGLTVNSTVQFSPNPVYTVNVAPGTFSSNHHIYADSAFYYAPRNFSAFYDPGWTPGTTHTLAVDTTEYPYSFATRFAFSNWSDGANTASHNVILPATSTTYTANVTPQFLVIDSTYPDCGGFTNISPSSPTNDGFYPTGTALTFTETPNSGWIFAGWQFDLTGTSSPNFLTVTDEVFVTTQYNTTTTPLTLTSLSPSEAVAGGPGFTLTLNGTGFTPSSPVSVNGTFPTVTFVNSTQLTVPVTAALIATPGVFQVWTDNFPSGAPCAAFVALPFTVDTGPTPTPTASPSATPVPTPTPSPTRTPSPTPTPTPSPTRTPSPTPTPTPSPTRTPSPTPTSTPTPTPTPPLISISGAASYCSNPVPGPVPNVAMALTGSLSGSTLSDASGNYTFTGLTSGGSYTVTPTKSALAPGFAAINTIDVVATQRHFLTVTLLTGCRLTAADVNGDSAVNTIDVVAIQRFFLGQSTGIANVGKYQFSPASRAYSGIVSNQAGQNYDTVTFGDVASPFAH